MEAEYNGSGRDRLDINNQHREKGTKMSLSRARKPNQPVHRTTYDNFWTQEKKVAKERIY